MCCYFFSADELITASILTIQRRGDRCVPISPCERCARIHGERTIKQPDWAVPGTSLVNAIGAIGQYLAGGQLEFEKRDGGVGGPGMGGGAFRRVVHSRTTYSR